MAKFLEKRVYVVEKWRKDRQTGGDDANVTFHVKPNPQINKGVSCVGPGDFVDEEKADDSRHADACCWEEVGLAAVCA